MHADTERTSHIDVYVFITALLLTVPFGGFGFVAWSLSNVVEILVVFGMKLLYGGIS